MEEAGLGESAGAGRIDDRRIESAVNPIAETRRSGEML